MQNKIKYLNRPLPSSYNNSLLWFFFCPQSKAGFRSFKREGERQMVKYKIKKFFYKTPTACKNNKINKQKIIEINNIKKYQNSPSGRGQLELLTKTFYNL